MLFNSRLFSEARSHVIVLSPERREIERRTYIQHFAFYDVCIHMDDVMIRFLFCSPLWGAHLNCFSGLSWHVARHVTWSPDRGLTQAVVINPQISTQADPTVTW